MNKLFAYYAENKLAWILPILIVLGLLAWLALTEADVPTDAFPYRDD
ncbi:MAG: hypothetical protein DHS20C15_15310 [Planctomycetota bacterium]|nr:MAG: hypothetical protein DHS20C15_15310 [Planctomycetota bacterium]